MATKYMSRPNILLVILDSVRAQNCSLYGHRNETTPFLSELATEATVYQQARSPSIHSIASHASIFSGLHTEEHNVTEHESHLDPTATIWHELRKGHDYSTGLFTPNVVVSESSNLDEPFNTTIGLKDGEQTRLFDRGLSPADLDSAVSSPQYLLKGLRDESPLRSILNGLYFKATPNISPYDPERTSATQYIEMTLDWIRDQSDSWAACVNLLDAHYPYLPQEDHNLWGGEPLADIADRIPNGPLSNEFLSGRPWGQLRALESLYDGSIHQLDTAIEQLVTGLKQSGDLEDTLLVITSDHGEGFGEQSRLTPPVRLVDHSWGIAEELTHIPLLVKEPGQDAGHWVSEVASLTRFPAVVKAGLNGQPAAEKFLPPDGRVLSSTYRITPPGEELPLDNETEKEPYFGPWRAVYENADDDVVKYASRREDAAKFRIAGTNVSTPIDVEGQVVDQEFSELADAGVAIGDPAIREVDQHVEDRLTELGYLR